MDLSPVYHSMSGPSDAKREKKGTTRPHNLMNVPSDAQIRYQMYIQVLGLADCVKAAFTQGGKTKKGGCTRSRRRHTIWLWVKLEAPFALVVYSVHFRLEKSGCKFGCVF